MYSYIDHILTLGLDLAASIVHVYKIEVVRVKAINKSQIPIIVDKIGVFCIEVPLYDAQSLLSRSWVQTTISTANMTATFYR